MKTISELENISKARIEDAEVLHNSSRYDGAIYLCGYAVEVSLKARICKTLGWQGFPSTGKEFSDFKSFKTHDLAVLLKLSGVEDVIKKKHLSEWSAVSTWNPEARYENTGNVSEADAILMIDSSKKLLRVL